MPVDKEFNTITNQIRLLKDRGLQFNDFISAKNHLLDKNYFNLINGLETLLLDDPKNPPKKYTKKSFENFLRIYDFDKKFSSLIFQKISEFETKLKASIAYHFCKNHCSTLAENNNYIDIQCYNIPKTTDGPKQYVDYFYNQHNPRTTHKLFKNTYNYRGKFRGTFDGIVTYNSNTTTLKGSFSGRFGSTSIREVKEGSCTFNNSKQSALLSLLHSMTTTSGTKIFLSINIAKDETIQGLTYIDDCKIKFPYINEYNNPPFWVIIKTLMLNDIIVLMYGLKKRTFDAVLKDFKLHPNDKEKFFNSLEIIRELRNSCAHFELVNRFRTPNKLKINARLISELHLNPIRSQYVIKLYDVLKVLRVYVDLSEIKLFLLDYWNSEEKFGNIHISISLFDRMGNSNIDDWI
ncbi:Abi family protein [Bacillus mobilis]|uniref:Abi family protein n=1 Tax=Bacillus mobilis TaxID=2026190 RepID=UPI0021D023BD|nr:Abi family protein [Bacillus mobilis]MCU5193706.1 Abi family protein [Bacillus mobilis]